jgi:exodeoxyribonuclease VII small subunit
MEKKKQSYKEAIEEIEEIVNKMENEALDVDELTLQVKRAAQLLKFCREKLYTTENEVDKIIKEIEKEQKSGSN